MSEVENQEAMIESMITAARERLNAYRKETGLSWADLEKVTGIPHGTISSFGGGTYKGKNERIARQVIQYFDHKAMVAEISGDIPDAPPYFETETSLHLSSLLSWGHRGRLIVAAMAPGTSKTETAMHYRDINPNVWYLALSPSTSGLNSLQIAVLAAMGQREARGTPQALKQRIVEIMQKSGGLLIIDEAQHISERALEEVRAWRDLSKCGIALLGNVGILSKFENYAQLYSRISYKLIRGEPLQADLMAQAAAWGITDPSMIGYLVREGQKPGGMRNVTHILELALLLAHGEGQTLNLSYLTDARAQLSTRPLTA